MLEKSNIQRYFSWTAQSLSWHNLGAQLVLLTCRFTESLQAPPSVTTCEMSKSSRNTAVFCTNFFMDSYKCIFIDIINWRDEYHYGVCNDALWSAQKSLFPCMKQMPLLGHFSNIPKRINKIYFFVFINKLNTWPLSIFFTDFNRATKAHRWPHNTDAAVIIAWDARYGTLSLQKILLLHAGLMTLIFSHSSPLNSFGLYL